LYVPARASSTRSEVRPVPQDGPASVWRHVRCGLWLPPLIRNDPCAAARFGARLLSPRELGRDRPLINPGREAGASSARHARLLPPPSVLVPGRCRCSRRGIFPLCAFLSPAAVRRRRGLRRAAAGAHSAPFERVPALQCSIHGDPRGIELPARARSDLAIPAHALLLFAPSNRPLVISLGPTLGPSACSVSVVFPSASLLLFLSSELRPFCLPTSCCAPFFPLRFFFPSFSLRAAPFLYYRFLHVVRALIRPPGSFSPDRGAPTSMCCSAALNRPASDVRACSSSCKRGSASAAEHLSSVPSWPFCVLFACFRPYVGASLLFFSRSPLSWLSALFSAASCRSPVAVLLGSSFSFVRVSSLPLGPVLIAFCSIRLAYLWVLGSLCFSIIFSLLSFPLSLREVGRSGVSLSRSLAVRSRSCSSMPSTRRRSRSRAALISETLMRDVPVCTIFFSFSPSPPPGRRG